MVQIVGSSGSCADRSQIGRGVGMLLYGSSVDQAWHLYKWTWRPISRGNASFLPPCVLAPVANTVLQAPQTRTTWTVRGALTKQKRIDNHALCDDVETYWYSVAQCATQGSYGTSLRRSKHLGRRGGQDARREKGGVTSGNRPSSSLNCRAWSRPGLSKVVYA